MAKHTDIYLYNKSYTHSVKANRVREFIIHEGIWRHKSGHWEGYEVRGWVNDNESFLFGKFKTRDEAKRFVDKLTSRAKKQPLEARVERKIASVVVGAGKIIVQGLKPKRRTVHHHAVHRMRR
jgi:hypothetical protein